MRIKLPLVALAAFGACAAFGARAAEQLPSILDVGGKPLQLQGPRECTYTPAGSIFEVRSAIWSVQQSAVNGNLNFTVFKLQSGAQLFSLFVLLDGKSHQVSTVKIADHGRLRGSGAIRVSEAAGGADFRINVSTDAGVRISGTIHCATFTSPQDNG